MAIYVALMERGYHVQIYSWGDVRDLYYESVYPKLKVLIIPYYERNASWRNMIHRYKAIRALKKSDLIKTNQIQGADMALEYSKRYGIPMITRCGYLLSRFTERQSEDQIYIDRMKALEKKVFVEADAGITSNPRDRDVVTEEYDLPDGKVTCVPNYVDQSTFSPVFDGRENGHLLYIGRLSPQKNLFALIEAVAGAKHVEKLTIIGQGEQREELEEKAGALADKVDIDFKGAIPNDQLPSYLQRCTAYILPSYYEGLPKTLLEAMSCGCACIGTDVEGIREVIVNGENGVLAHMDKVALQQVIERVMSDGSLRERIGKGAYETIKETYSLKNVVEVEKSVYEGVILGNAESAKRRRGR